MEPDYPTGILLVPYQSEKQRRFMHAEHPDIAARWDKEARKKTKRKKRGRAATRR
jgi:hypothetical protein